MMTDYIQAVMDQAIYRLSPEDQLIYGEIPGFDRVEASAETLEECRSQLVEALEEWIFFRISRQIPVPIVDGVDLPLKDVL